MCKEEIEEPRIVIGNMYKRVHGDQQIIMIVDYNDTHVIIEDNQGRHPISLDEFNFKNFKE